MRETAEEYLINMARNYRLKESCVTINNRTFVVWSTTGVDELITDDTDPDEIPYWAELWPSAVALARRFASEPGLAGRTVLELGCGTALPSITASLAGARVTATDYVEDALAFAKANAELNGAQGITFTLLDWRNPPMLGRFDYVTGADILYERKLHQHVKPVLEGTVDRDGRVIIADPCRPAAVEFMAEMETSGWDISMSEEHLPGMVQELVILYTLTRRRSAEAPG